MRNLVERLERIGRGGFGSVWLMREKAASLKVAVKEMDYESEAEKKMIHNEIAVMKYIY